MKLYKAGLRKRNEHIDNIIHINVTISYLNMSIKAEGDSVIKDVIFVTASTLSLVGLSLFGFGSKKKNEVAELQHGLCPVCGQKLGKHTEGHHRVPESLGGNDGISNCIVVDAGGSGERDCHEILDVNAKKKKLIFLSQDSPEVPLADVPVKLFKNQATKIAILIKYGLNK